MMIEEVRNTLQEKGDFRLLFVESHNPNLILDSGDPISDNLEKESLKKSFWDSGLEVWINDHRVAVTKVYESLTYFKESWRDNQIILSNLLNFLPLKYKNNLYFLLVLEFECDQEFSNELLVEINKAEKNANYCRKYILQDESDFERIPFFYDVEKKSGPFSYEKRFIELLTQKSQGIDNEIVQTINDYFKPEMRAILNDKLKFKNAIEKKFGGDINYAITPDEC